MSTKSDILRGKCYTKIETFTTNREWLRTLYYNNTLRRAISDRRLAKMSDAECDRLVRDVMNE